jgi:hypothetical protein
MSTIKIVNGEAIYNPGLSVNIHYRHMHVAVFVLVKNGRVMFTKGYGLARLEERTPAIPDRTLFRVASMHLVTHGRCEPAPRTASVDAAG